MAQVIGSLHIKEYSIPAIFTIFLSNDISSKLKKDVCTNFSFYLIIYKTNLIKLMVENI